MSRVGSKSADGDRDGDAGAEAEAEAEAPLVAGSSFSFGALLSDGDGPASFSGRSAGVTVAVGCCGTCDTAVKLLAVFFSMDRTPEVAP